MKCSLFFIGFFFSLQAFSAIIYVKPDGISPVADGSSWAMAFGSVRDAWDVAEPGDQIWVQEGEYLLYEQIRIGNSVELYCGFAGYESTLNQRNWEAHPTIFTQPFTTTVYLSPINIMGSTQWSQESFATIDGATFENFGFVTPMSQMMVSTDWFNLTLRNCEFKNITTTAGFFSFFEIYSAEVLMENCDFFNIQVPNEMFYEGNRGNVTYRDCNFNLVSMMADPDEAVFVNSQFENTSFRNCSFSFFTDDECALNGCLIENCSFNDVTRPAFDDTFFTNCTVVNNDCAAGLMGDGNVYNSIFYGNTNDSSVDLLSPETYCLNVIVQEDFNGTGSNVLQTDPLFVNPAQNNWRLTECSEAIDNTGIGFSILPYDLNGNDRVFNNELDMGCYEYQGTGKAVIYVDADATGNNDGSSWGNAFNEIQDAIDAQCEHSEIWVAHGVYFPNANGSPNREISITIPSGTEIYGSFEGFENSRAERTLEDFFVTGDRSAIRGDNGPDPSEQAYNVIEIETGATDVIIDGFYIAAGRADGLGTNSVGGAIRMQDASIKVSNCRFEGNYAEFGGVIFVNGSSVLNLSNCFLDGNSAGQKGGAICALPFNGQSPTLFVDRCRLFINQAVDGGAFYGDDGQFFLTNSVFTTNIATNDGDGINAGGIIQLGNCTVVSHGEAFRMRGELYAHNTIFWNNSVDVQNGSGWTYREFLHCNTSVPISGVGMDLSNTVTDPLFENAAQLDYRLKLESPMINSGANNLTAGVLDFDEENRIHDGTVDRGAHEFNGSCLPLNDDCINAATIDVSVFQSIPINMECANPEIDSEGCGTEDSRTRWYRFTMPDYRVQLFLGSTPEQTFEDRSIMIKRNDCAENSSLCGQSLILDYPEGQEMLVKVSYWGSADQINLRVNPLDPYFTAINPGAQSDCNLGAPNSLYDQTIFIFYENADSYEEIEINGERFDLAPSPMEINLEDIWATGDFMDLEVSIVGSNAYLLIEDFVQTPCCAPVNDNCHSPVPLLMGVTQPGRMDCATQSPLDVLSSCTQDPGNSLWYSFIAPNSGSISMQSEIEQTAGQFNVRLSVWDVTNECNDPVEVACLNDLPYGQNEYGEFDGFNPGQEYRVMVSGWQNQKGNFNITIDEVNTCFCTGDFNGDCAINSADLTAFLAEFGCTQNCSRDLNGDGVVNSADLTAFLAVYGGSCD